MAFEEVESKSFEDDPREILNAKIGLEFEGYYVRKSRVKESKFGKYQVFFFDLLDGRKIGVRASEGKPIHDKLSGANLEPGHLVKAVVEAGLSKADNTFANARVFVDRSPSKPAPAEAPAEEPEAVPADADDSEPDF